MTTLVVVIVAVLLYQQDLPEIKEKLHPTTIGLYSESYTGPLYLEVQCHVLEERRTVEDGFKPVFQLKPGELYQIKLPSRVVLAETPNHEIICDYEIDLWAGGDHWRLYIFDGQVIRVPTAKRPEKTKLAIGCSHPIPQLPAKPGTLKDGLVALAIQTKNKDYSFQGIARFLDEHQGWRPTKYGIQVKGAPENCVVWLLPNHQKKGLSLGTGTLETVKKSDQTRFGANQIEIVKSLRFDQPIRILRIKVESS